MGAAGRVNRLKSEHLHEPTRTTGFERYTYGILFPFRYVEASMFVFNLFLHGTPVDAT